MCLLLVNGCMNEHGGHVDNKADRQIEFYMGINRSMLTCTVRKCLVIYHAVIFWSVTGGALQIKN